MNKSKQTQQANQSVAEITQELIARRAYEISQSEQAGSADENWVRAEHELLEEQVALPETLLRQGQGTQ